MGRRDEKKGRWRMDGRADSDEEWLSVGGKGSEGEDCSRVVSLAAVCFPQCGWFLLFLQSMVVVFISS